MTLAQKKFFFIFRIVATAAILFALLKLVPYKKIIEVYQDSHKIYLLLAGLVFLSCHLLGIVRWQFLLSAVGIHMPLREVCYAFFSGLFFNLFFPSFVAGDVFRSMAISYRHGSAKKVASTVLMDRFSGSIALALVALSAFISGRNILSDPQITIAVLILCIISIFMSLIIFSKPIFLFLTRTFRRNKTLEEKIVSFHDQLYFFTKNPKVFFKSLYFSLPIQILVPLSFFITSRAFGVELNIIYFLILVPIVMAITLIPITIAGAGTREVSAVYFFSLVGVNKSIGLGISLFNLIITIFLGILGGIFYVSIYHRWLQSHAPSSQP